MNLQQLKDHLNSAKVHPDAVGIGVGLPYETEKYCIVKEGKYWEVYYSERGNKSGLKRFSLEEDACKHLLELLDKDQSVWLR